MKMDEKESLKLEEEIKPDKKHKVYDWLIITVMFVFCVAMVLVGGWNIWASEGMGIKMGWRGSTTATNYFLMFLFLLVIGLGFVFAAGKRKAEASWRRLMSKPEPTKNEVEASEFFRFKCGFFIMIPVFCLALWSLGRFSGDHLDYGRYAWGSFWFFILGVFVAS